MAGRKPDTTEKHTPASIAHAAAELDQISARLKTAATLLEIEPAISGIDVRYETSLVDGLNFLRNWSDEVARKASDARRESAKRVAMNHRVRKTGHVSEGQK